MPCYACSSEFGILRKEIGCENCGFSFCSKCCKKREVATQDVITKKLLCNQCFSTLSSKKTSTVSSTSPPLAHKKRMAALKKQSFSVDSGCQWSNEKDKEIAERLHRLKRDRIKDDLPSEMEIEERLAKLKGMDPNKYKAPPIQVFRPTEKRTSIEEATELMKQLKAEADLDSRLVKPEDEIAARLARLKDQVPEEKNDDVISSSAYVGAEYSEGMDVETANVEFEKEYLAAAKVASNEVQELHKDTDYKKLFDNMKKEKGSKDEDGDEEEANKLVEKLMATNIDDDMEELESLNGPDEKPSIKSQESAAEEEFPWCVICTEDAKIRCFGCDSDLYCMHCFKECHDSLDIRDHKTCPFLPPKNPCI